MNETPKCPKCGSEFTYFDGSLYVCPDCTHEFHAGEEVLQKKIQFQETATVLNFLTVMQLL